MKISSRNPSKKEVMWDYALDLRLAIYLKQMTTENEEIGELRDFLLSELREKYNQFKPISILIMDDEFYQKIYQVLHA